MQKIVSFFDFVVSILVGVLLLLLISFIGYELYVNVVEKDFFQPGGDKEIIYAIALMVILVKAYTILISYVQTHHVKIKYIVEISIIAPALEIIFNPEAYDLYINILWGVLAMFNLFVYLQYYDKLREIDRIENMDNKIQDFFNIFRRK